MLGNVSIPMCLVKEALKDCTILLSKERKTEISVLKVRIELSNIDNFNVFSVNIADYTLIRRPSKYSS